MRGALAGGLREAWDSAVGCVLEEGVRNEDTRTVYPLMYVGGVSLCCPGWP